ncbi:hypothetical protein RUM44_000122 [Polyplax serrata]|uniref:Uncharacterized protein n=1 Tax=Polyplax serrata TaxID=468196 RepID=A0ABR1B5A9_POLSC
MGKSLVGNPAEDRRVWLSAGFRFKSADLNSSIKWIQTDKAHLLRFNRCVFYNDRLHFCRFVSFAQDSVIEWRDEGKEIFSKACRDCGQQFGTPNTEFIYGARSFKRMESKTNKNSAH